MPSVPTASFGFDHPAQAWSQASGCETGGIWPTPDGRVIWGACKGEVERFNVETGQSQGKWIYPQNRYGHHPDDIKFRFPRQTVIMVSPHDPKTVYQASHVLHRSTDDGVTWQVISPDLTAHEKEYQVVPGNPITRDVTGEEVYSAIYAMDESPIERGVIWVGANDGPVHVTRDNGKTWKNVTPPDLPPGGRVQNIDASPHPQAARRTSPSTAILREHDLKPYIYRTDDYGATWTKLTDGANGIPADHPTRVVREDPERAGLLYAGTEFGIFVSFDNGGALAAAAAEPAGDAGHRHPRPPRRPRHRDDGAVVLDHGRRRSAACPRGARCAKHGFDGSVRASSTGARASGCCGCRRPTEISRGCAAQWRAGRRDRTRAGRSARHRR